MFLDRWSRRTIFVLANSLRALAVLPAAALIWSGNEGTPLVLLVLVMVGLNRFILAGLSAALPHVVEDKRLVTGNAVATTLGTVCFSLGLGTAVLLGQVVPPGFRGYAMIAAPAAVGYVLAALIAWRSFGRAELGPDDVPLSHDNPVTEIVEVAQGMVSGLVHLVRRPPAALAMAAQTVHRVLYGVLALATLLLYRNYFNPSQGDDFSAAKSGLGQVVLAGAAGGLLAAFLTPVALRRISGSTWITVLLAGVGVAIAVLGTPFEALLLVLAVFFLNIASQGMKIVVDSTIQHECTDDYRGRVFAVNDTLYNLAFVTGLFAGVWLLPADGHSLAILATVATGYLLLAFSYGLATRRAPQATPATATR